MNRRMLKRSAAPSGAISARYWLSFVAAVALLFQALVPTYAMAAVAPPGEGMIPICTADGIIWISLTGEETPDRPTPQADKPCHFCFAKNAPMAPASAATLVPFARAIVELLGWAPVETLRENQQSGPAGIRAPPLLLIV